MKTCDFGIYAPHLSPHHQGKQNDGVHGRIEKSCNPSAWIEMQDELHALIQNEFIPPVSEIKTVKNLDSISFLLLGITILSDWISSDDTVYMQKDKPINLRLKNALELRGLTCDLTELPCATFGKLWPELMKFELWGVQEAAQEQPP